MADDRPPSMKIVSAVADSEGADPTDIPPLYQVIDPDALDNLLADRSVTVSFEYFGYNVVFDRSGTVELTPTDAD